MDKRKQMTIASFFNKKPKSNNGPDPASTSYQNVALSCDSGESRSEIHPVCEASLVINASSSISEISGSSRTTGTANTDNIDLLAEPLLKNDIAVIKTTQVSEKNLNEILNDVWQPESSFKFPGSAAGKNEAFQRRFQFSWLKKYSWLAYSKLEDAAYCKYCVLFVQSNVGHNKGETVGHLVQNGFNKWKHAIEIFNNHGTTRYHRDAVVSARNLEQINRGKCLSVDRQLNKAYQEECMENKKRLVPILKTIILCGKQGLALRGHRDFGPINLEETPTHNEGNFRALLRLRVDAGDLVLENHLKTAPKNALYTSWRIQNELIECCGTMIQKDIIKKVKAAKFFTVLADETTDISCIQQLSICVRYVDEINFKICEDFLCFVPLTAATGEALANEIISQLENLGLKVADIRGQGYDGAAAMSGKVSGVQTRISNLNPKAVYVHCVAHCLNLVITDSCNIQDIRNCMGTLEKVCVFFNYPKRRLVLEKFIEELCPESKKQKLKKMCPTRWVQRHDSVIVFLELFNCVCAALTEVSSWEDKDASTDANLLLNAILSSQFLVSLYVLESIFSYSILLSKYLQSVELDLGLAIKHADLLKQKLENIRQNAEDEFHLLFLKVESKCNEFEVALAMPRIAKRQTNRCNVQCENAETYFRITIFIPFLDNFLKQLNTRFLKHQEILSSFMCLLPIKNIDMSSIANLKKIFLFYEQDFCSENDAFLNENLLISEYKMWQSEVSQKDVSSAIEALSLCDRNIYPNIFILLKIFATLPVSTCTTEGSNSTLKRLKTYLRNTIGEDRLVGLALMNIYFEYNFNIEEVINLFTEKNRRLKLQL